MRRSLRIAFRMVLLTMLATGLLYPLAMTGVAAVAFPRASRGSLVERGGAVVGSCAIAQDFESDAYFHSRPSSIGYDPMRSGASNLAPTSKELVEQVRDRRERLVLREGLDPGTLVPIDAVTTSGSGLDPDISPAAAHLQIDRVASARGLEEAVVAALVETHVRGPQLGFLGEPRVNVLELNIELDALSSQETR